MSGIRHIFRRASWSTHTASSRAEPTRFPFAWAVIAWLLVPAAVCGLLWKGLRYRPYLRRWPERFALGLTHSAQPSIWVHAVSVGEVRSAVPLVRALMRQYPRHRVLVTTMTPTGAQQVSLLLGEEVEHRYLPWDLPDAAARFLDRVRPELAVIAETEFWPNLFHACQRRGIALALVNVRISAGSLAGYLRVPKTSRAMFCSADLVCAQTRTDAQRLRNLGVEAHRLFVTGNLKFDFPVPQSVIDAGRALRERWGADRFVWVAGSTHAGEEERIVRAFAQLQQRIGNILLVIVPRDPERFSSVARLVRRRGLSVRMHSEPRQPDGAVETDVIVGDTMGELHAFYAAGDVAFVGASLVRRGGHNVLEPAAVGIPVVFGPHMYNFEDIAAGLLEAGAGVQVYDADELSAAIALYASNCQLRTAAGLAGRKMVGANSGAVRETIKLLSRTLPGRSGTVPSPDELNADA